MVETVNFIYNNLATGPCDVVTDVCLGIASNHLGTSIDLTGWIWANSADVAEMFEFVTGAPDGIFDADTASYFDLLTDASWALDFIDGDGLGPDTDQFNATAEYSSGIYGVLGVTRTVVNGDTDRSYIRSTDAINFAVVGNPHGFESARLHTGLRFYQMEAVSEPSVSFTKQITS